jgi:hypothetical protein
LYAGSISNLFKPTLCTIPPSRLRHSCLMTSSFEFLLRFQVHFTNCEPPHISKMMSKCLHCDTFPGLCRVSLFHQSSLILFVLRELLILWLMKYNRGHTFNYARWIYHSMLRQTSKYTERRSPIQLPTWSWISMVGAVVDSDSRCWSPWFPSVCSESLQQSDKTVPGPNTDVHASFAPFERPWQTTPFIRWLSGNAVCRSLGSSPHIVHQEAWGWPGLWRCFLLNHS